jgi:hypothetical protein
MTTSPPIPPPAAAPAAAPPPAEPGRPWWRSPFVLLAAGFLALVLVVFAVGLVIARATDDDGVGDLDGGGAHVVTGPLGDRREATLELVHGAHSITIRADDLGDRLYRVATPDDSHLLPDVDDGDGDDPVRVRLVERGAPGVSAVDIQLHSGVRWTLRLLGGANDELIDLRESRLAGLDIAGGVSLADIALPPPEGVVAVRMTGGAGQLRLHAPAGVPVRVECGSGAGTVTVDATAHPGVAAGSVFEPPNWSAAQNRYDVQAVAGVGTLTVDRSP